MDASKASGDFRNDDILNAVSVGILEIQLVIKDNDGFLIFNGSPHH